MAEGKEAIVATQLWGDASIEEVGVKQKRKEQIRNDAQLWNVKNFNIAQAYETKHYLFLASLNKK